VGRVQRAGVADRRALWRTALKRPKPESVSSSRSCTSPSCGSGQAKSLAHAPEPSQPGTGAGERDFHKPASTLRSTSVERCDDAKGEQIARGVVQSLGRERLRLIGAGCVGLGSVEAGCCLHEAVKPASARPGAAIAVSAQRAINNARPNQRRLMRPEAALAYGSGAVGLHKHVGALKQFLKLAATDFGR
jgi:hypothetical protein